MPADIATAVSTAKLGQVASSALQADRVTNIRVMMDPKSVSRIETLSNIPIKTPNGSTIRLSQVADVKIEPGQLELWRDDLRQYVAVIGELDKGNDLAGTVMTDWIKAEAGQRPPLPRRRDRIWRPLSAAAGNHSTT